MICTKYSIVNAIGGMSDMRIPGTRDLLQCIFSYVPVFVDKFEKAPPNYWHSFSYIVIEIRRIKCFPLHIHI